MKHLYAEYKFRKNTMDLNQVFFAVNKLFTRLILLLLEMSNYILSV